MVIRFSSILAQLGIHLHCGNGYFAHLSVSLSIT